MNDQKNSLSRFVIGPDGQRLTLADLPPADTRRWVIRRKAEVVAAVRGGLLTMEEACEHYSVSHGIQGLRTTQIKKYRETEA